MDTLKTCIALLLSILVCAASVHSEQTPTSENLSWKYAEFVHAFGEKDWTTVCRFVSSATKAGFGPNEEGCTGVMRVYGKDNQCWYEIMFALRQGCKVTSSGGNITCVAPPQWVDESVVYLGARAGFAYDLKTDKLTATYLICGGD
ncbi:MAG: hypothetical protein D3910_23950 [Candidatus Electrothrix sp. ATG2]|nr:hypothetical protein [Candidatus Electrothrix sp. ATG2]